MHNAPTHPRTLTGLSQPSKMTGMRALKIVLKVFAGLVIAAR
jgi:hypothetical protein